MVVASHVEVMFYLLVMDILLLIKIEVPMAWQRHQISSIEALYLQLSYQLWSNSPALYLQEQRLASAFSGCFLLHQLSFCYKEEQKITYHYSLTLNVHMIDSYPLDVKSRKFRFNIKVTEGFWTAKHGTYEKLNPLCASGRSSRHLHFIKKDAFLYGWAHWRTKVYAPLGYSPWEATWSPPLGLPREACRTRDTMYRVVEKHGKRVKVSEYRVTLDQELLARFLALIKIAATAVTCAYSSSMPMFWLRIDWHIYILYIWGESATPSTSTTTERALNPNQEIQLLQYRGHRQPLKEWEPAIVVFRSSIFCPWELIEERFKKELNLSVSLKPLGEDRAVLFCTSEIERDKLLTRTAAIGGDLIDKACTWKPEVHWEERRWGGANCWISLSGIPLSMWNREAFAKIAERFGGLLEINILTLQRQNLERAVVKVKGRLKGFFPTEVVIPSPEGVLAKISVAKFRVEDRCVDPIQMREFFGLIGASEQRMPVDDNGGDLDPRFENAKDCRVEDPTTKKNQGRGDISSDHEGGDDDASNDSKALQGRTRGNLSCT
ncbi:hypothetical protein Sjap_009210 [Stephania japonica]|uniref:DUF4283 domain-containing protein n=1 Tax=Stephania japonica TaxID=461633 RepID=A0AAP0JRP6_9MAGN